MEFRYYSLILEFVERHFNMHIAQGYCWAVVYIEFYEVLLKGGVQ